MHNLYRWFDDLYRWDSNRWYHIIAKVVIGIVMFPIWFWEEYTR